MDSVDLKINLQCRVKKDTGTRWIAWCPALDVVSQGVSKEDAKRCLEEAIELWVESCLERSTLDQALQELNFRKAGPVEVGSTHRDGRVEDAPLADPTFETFPVRLSIPAFQVAA